MSDTPSYGDKAAALRDRAVKLYHDLAAELERALSILRTGANDPDAKGRAETIRAHRKALQTILEIELQLFSKQKQDGRVHEINLDAARTEIRGRLDRIANAI